MCFITTGITLELDAPPFVDHHRHIVLAHVAFAQELLERARCNDRDRIGFISKAIVKRRIPNPDLEQVMCFMRCKGRTLDHELIR